jgi:nucleoside-diphosphate-sugar epimerase
MKYFLTGATGFIGGVLARQLREAGYQVVAVVRTPSKATELEKLGVQLAKGDVTDKESMRAAMTGVDGVFHVAGWYKIGTKDKAEGYKINVDGTRNVLELMRELAIQKGVYTSTLAVNSDTHGVEVDENYQFSGQHISVYDETKAKAHDLAEAMMAQGLPLVTVQPGLVYGPADTSAVRAALIQLLQGKLPVVPLGSAYSWAHVEDIAHAHWLAMARGKVGESYFICGPTHTYDYGMTLAADAAKVRLPMKVPGSLLRASAPLMGLLEKVIALPETYTAENMRVVGGSTYIGKNDKACRELGYAPRTLEEGWVQTVRHEMALLGMTA